MIENIIGFLPELSLLLSLPLLWVVNLFRKDKTPKTFFTISKVFLSITIITTIIFYNVSYYPDVLINTPYTSLFKTIIYAFALAWFYLSLKWFLSKNISSFGFYFLCILSILCLGLSVSARNFLMLFITLELSFFLNYYLLKLTDITDVKETASRYICFAWVFCLLFAGGLAIIYNQTGSFDYKTVYEYIIANPYNLNMFIAVILVLAAIFYMIGIAPFHFWFADSLGATILPVSGYLTLIPIFAYFACFIGLIYNVFMPVYPLLKNIIAVFGGISMVFGSLCANREENIRKLFAYSTLFHLGVIFITIACFNQDSLFTAFVYLITYILSISGIYAVFYGFKIKGDYLINLKDISGIFKQKPYLSAAFLIFMFSQIGCPPILGFLGRFSVIDNLINEQHYYLIFTMLVSIILLADAYLRVIKVTYFTETKIKFDRTDKGIYIFLGLNILLVLLTIFRPRHLLHGFEQLLASIF